MRRIPDGETREDSGQRDRGGWGVGSDEGIDGEMKGGYGSGDEGLPDAVYGQYKVGMLMGRHWRRGDGEMGGVWRSKDEEEREKEIRNTTAKKKSD